MHELVLDCVIPYIQDNHDLNSLSLVSKKFFDIDSKTRKHLTVHVHFAPDPRRLSLRFPNLESLTLKSYSYGQNKARKCSISVFPWILEIAVNFKRLKSLSIRNMVMSDFELHLLAKTRGCSLRSLEIRGCKMFSEEGLIDIARDCKDLRSLRLEYNDMPGYLKGKWLHELALCNTVMESLDVNLFPPMYSYDIEDVTLLAKKCSKSLVCLKNNSGRSLDDFREVFNHAKKLNHFGNGHISYSNVKLPPDIRGLCIHALRKDKLPFLLPYVSQLRELYLPRGDIKQNCQCFLFERCLSLEVLVSDDACGDIGLQVIGKFCKNLRKFTHQWDVTQMGLIALAQGCPNLEYLQVILSDISNEALECVGTHLKNLRDFRCLRVMEVMPHFEYSPPLDNGVRAMLMGCSKLERLDVTLRYGDLTDVGLGYIGEYGHNLRRLSLRYMGLTLRYTTLGLSDAGLLELCKGCPKLRKLNLIGCSFSEQAITTFVFNINYSLKYIRIHKSDYHDDGLVLTRPMVSAQVNPTTEEKPSETHTHTQLENELQTLVTGVGGPTTALVLSRPMDSAEVLTGLYVTLAEKLRRLAVQLVADGSGSEYVKITYTSSEATDDHPNLVAKGIQNEERLVLDGSSEKPLKFIVQVSEVESRFATAVSEFREIQLQGRVKDGVPHLTKVGAFEVDVSLEGNILLCRQADQATNTISRVTSILGEENVNINSMSVGRPAPGKRVVMVIGIDENPSKEALKKIDESPAVEEFVFVAL